MRKRVRQRLVLCLSVPALFLAAGAAEAEMVNVDFSGTIWVVSDKYGDLAAAGIESGTTPFSGRLAYDTASAQWDSQPTFTQYWASSYTVEIGDGLSWSSSGSGGGIAVQDNRTVGPDTYDMFDAYQGGYASVNGKDIWMDALVWMKDNSLLSFSSTALPTAGTLNSFNMDDTFFRISGYDDTDERAWDLGGNSDMKFSISGESREASVPEPSIIALLGSLLTGMAAAKRFRLKD